MNIRTHTTRTTAISVRTAIYMLVSLADRLLALFLLLFTPDSTQAFGIRHPACVLLCSVSRATTRSGQVHCGPRVRLVSVGKNKEKWLEQV